MMNRPRFILRKCIVQTIFTKFLRNCSDFRSVSSSKDDLIVKFDENQERFPLVWLRDNCRCEKCFDQIAQSRIINWNDFNIDVKVKSIETHPENKNVTINWEDDHKSNFTLEWLKKRRFTEGAQKTFLEDIYRPSKILWDNHEFAWSAKRYDYYEVMNNDRKFYNWIKDLARYGVVFMENSPLDKNVSHEIADKIAFIKKTHYGGEFYITAKPDAGNVAYLSSFLQLHTDLPYYNYKPGVTVLHCITQHEGNGGENMLSDGFFVAQKLKEENKKVFDILSTVDVNWIDVGEENGMKYHKLLRAPIIKLDSEGNIESIRRSVPQRDSYFTTDLKNVKPWYEAYKVFVELINKHSVTFKTKAGDVLTFDNTRLVHGRMAYEDSTENQRFVVGSYFDWDEIYSKLRVLQNESHREK